MRTTGFSHVVAAFVVVVCGLARSAAAQQADASRRTCPMPFPGDFSSAAGSCRCTTNGDGLNYECEKLTEWHRPAASDAQRIVTFLVVRGQFPSSTLPRYFLVSFAPKVTHFTCSHSGLTAIEPYAFANVSKLIKLNLDGNNIRVLTALAFSGLNDLAELSLRRAGIAVISPDAFLNLKGVEYVLLSDNIRLVVEPFAFRNVSGINQLDLRNHGMRHLNASFLAGLSVVQNLVLKSSNGIDELSNGAFSGISDIGTVEIVSSGLQRVQPGAFVGAARIGRVVLNMNAITTIEKGSLDGGVGAIDWVDNPVSCDERLAWLFDKGGLGDGLSERLLSNMVCAQPADLLYANVAGLRDVFRQRGYLDRLSAETATPPTTFAAAATTFRTLAPSIATDSWLRRLLPEYIARMNSTKNRPSRAAAHRLSAAASFILVSSSVLIAAVPVICLT